MLQLPDRTYRVRQGIILQIPAANVDEIYDDESQLCERLTVVVIQGKGLPANQIST